MPRRLKDDPRDINLTIRFSDAERASLQALAQQAGCSLAVYTRRVLFGAAAADATEPAPERRVVDLGAARLAEELRRVGVNLNQIARRMNEYREPAPDDLAAVIGEIRAYVRQAREL